MVRRTKTQYKKQNKTQKISKKSKSKIHIAIPSHNQESQT